MTRDEIVKLAAQKAAEHRLPPEAVLAVVEQESGFVPWAMRYEPAFFSKYVAPMVQNGMNATEGMARACSFGLMQVMGQTARELGFDGSSLAELCDPERGVEYGCRKLYKCWRESAGIWKKAFALYNGAGVASYQYAERAVPRMEKWKANLALTAAVEVLSRGQAVDSEKKFP